jgi:hypothetical protein
MSIMDSQKEMVEPAWVPQHHNTPLRTYTLRPKIYGI